MKILFVNSAWPRSWGGGEKWTVEAALWCVAHGHRAHVAGRPASLLLAQAAARGLEVAPFLFRGDFDPRSRLAAARLLDTLTPDLLVVNFNKEVWTFAAAARRRAIPLIARHGFPLFRDRWHHRRFLARRITQLVVNAESIRREYERLGMNVSAVRVIHNGVHIVEQDRPALRRELGCAPDDVLIAAAGRLESQKRFDRFIRLAANLHHTSSKTRFVLFGQGPDEPDLRRQAHAAGLDIVFRFAGFRSDFASIIGGADLFVLTSENEGTPNVLLEALAARVACVSFGVGSVPDILHGELAANCLPPGDEQALWSRVEWLAADAERRAAVAAAGARRAHGEFSFDASMRRYDDLFTAALEQP